MCCALSPFACCLLLVAGAFGLLPVACRRRLSVVCSLVGVRCWLLAVVCCSLFVARRALFSVRCLLCVVVDG